MTALSLFCFLLLITKRYLNKIVLIIIIMSQGTGLVLSPVGVSGIPGCGCGSGLLAFNGGYVTYGVILSSGVGVMILPPPRAGMSVGVTVITTGGYVGVGVSDG